jgi:hypothetical protein
MATPTGSLPFPRLNGRAPRSCRATPHHRPHRLKAGWRTRRHHRIEADGVSADPIMEGDVGKLLGDNKAPVVDKLVGAVIHLIALMILEPNWPSAVKKCECICGTAPWQGCLGSAIWSGDDTPGQEPVPGDVLQRDLLVESRLGEDLPRLLTRLGPAPLAHQGRGHGRGRGCSCGAAEAVPLLSSAPPQAAASRARLATRISGPNRRRVGMRHPPSVRRHHQRDGRRLILSRPITRANAACRPRATSSGHQQTSLDFGSAPACLRSTSSSPVRVRPVHGGSRRSHGGGTARGSGTGFRKARE